MTTWIIYEELWKEPRDDGGYGDYTNDHAAQFVYVADEDLFNQLSHSPDVCLRELARTSDREKVRSLQHEIAYGGMTTAEAAAALGLARRAVQRAIRVGTLPATRQGRDWFVSQAAIEDYRANHLRRYGRKSKA